MYSNWKFDLYITHTIPKYVRNVLMCSLYIWIHILNLTYPNISMLVTMRQASNADRADNIILVEFPRIWGLRNTMIQIMFPTSPINPTVFVMIPWRINENKINLGSSSLFPTYHFGGNNIWKWRMQITNKGGSQIVWNLS